MKKILLSLFSFILFSFTLYSESQYFSNNDLNILLSAKIENNNIHIYISIKNKKSESCYIPYDYLNFYCEVDNEQTMKNNWLVIKNNSNEEIPYFGIMSSPIIKWDLSDCYYLAKDQEYIISLYDIKTNYLLGSTKRISIKYSGPLGESNTVFLKIKK